MVTDCGYTLVTDWLHIFGENGEVCPERGDFGRLQICNRSDTKVCLLCNLSLSANYDEKWRGYRYTHFFPKIRYRLSEQKVWRGKKLTIGASDDVVKIFFNNHFNKL